MLEERIAWIVDPYAFSEDIAHWERKNPGRGIWNDRRVMARAKARQILAVVKEEPTNA